MSENDRQQRMVERILEDERLRGDLEDTAATAVINWASQRAAAAAADVARHDDAVEAEVQAVRKAARAAALSGETDPQRLIAVAEAHLAPHMGLNRASTEATPAVTAAAPPQAQGAPSADQAPRQARVPRKRMRNRLANFLKRVIGGR